MAVSVLCRFLTVPWGSRGISLPYSLSPPPPPPRFHWTAIPLRPLSLKLFQKVDIQTIWGLDVPVRFHYSCTRLLPRFRYAAAALVTILLWYQCVSAAFEIVQGDSATTMKIRLRLVFADGDATTLLRPRRWSYAFVAFLNPLYTKTENQLIYTFKEHE